MNEARSGLGIGRHSVLQLFHFSASISPLAFFDTNDQRASQLASIWATEVVSFGSVWQLHQTMATSKAGEELARLDGREVAIVGYAIACSRRSTPQRNCLCAQLPSQITIRAKLLHCSSRTHCQPNIQPITVKDICDTTVVMPRRRIFAILVPLLVPYGMVSSKFGSSM